MGEDKVNSPPSKKPRKNLNAKNEIIKSNRTSGRMSLRPNRRVNVNKSYREFNEADSSENDELDVDDVDAVNDIDEVLDGDFSEDFVLQRNNDDKDPLKMTIMGSTALKGVGKGKKRRIIYTGPSTTTNDSSQENENNEPYNVRKDQICAVCSKELDSSRLSGYKNLFEDVTNVGGVSLYKIFIAIVKTQVSIETHGCRVCNKCVSMLQHIESLYTQYRRAVDIVIDTFEFGQRLLDADVCGKEISLSVVNQEVEEEEEIEQQRTRFSDLLDVSLITIKVVQRDDVQFNAYGVGTDFNLTIEKIYNGSVILEQDFPSESTTDTDTVITITFDMNTGNIERSLNYTDAEVNTETYDANQPLYYVTRDELYAMKKTISQRLLYLSKTDFDAGSGKLILGHKITHQIILSPILAESYSKRFPEMKNNFICGDCSVSCRFFHGLSNHVHSVHKHGEPETIDTSEIVAKVGTKKTVSKTGEVPTLEKPFQCEHCDKCFSEYLNMSTHVDHYHGYIRHCNIEGCDTVSNSIQDFALHYVRHGQKDFQFPEEFREKTKIYLPCPMCSIRVQGIWKFFSHTYIHDKEPRFKCPVCSKRTHKVQNFREHLIRHRGPEFKNRKCHLCDKIFYPQDLHRHMKQVHPGATGASTTNSGTVANVPRFPCDVCGKIFSTIQKLRYHQEIHTPKESWIHGCTTCDQFFPSLSRLKLHVNESHFACDQCHQNFTNSFELDAHKRNKNHVVDVVVVREKDDDDDDNNYNNNHDNDNNDDVVTLKSSEIGNFQCMECGSRDSTVIAARKHYRLIHRDKPFTCNLCKRVFTKELALHGHLTKAHPEVVGTGPLSGDKTHFPCVFCGRMFNKAVTRLRHTRFIHLVETIDIREMGEEVTVIGDQISEYDENFENIIKLHSIP